MTPAKLGSIRIAQNGYKYTKVAMSGPDQWRLTHHIRAEEKLGRPINTDVERVFFIDGDRTNLAYSNLKVEPKGKGSLKRREAVLEDRIRELTAQLEDIKLQIKKQENRDS
jgi:hypothetical protein